MSNHQTIEQINKAIGAHGTWKMRLSVAINTGQFDTDIHTASCDDKCAFGQWIHGPNIDATTRAGMPYQVIRRLHADFHKSAGAVLGHALTGRKAEAKSLLQSEYTERSENLTRALNKWKRELS
jgi:hypothetical protein